MSDMFALIDPTALHSEDDIRVTTYDLYKIVKKLGGTQNHHDIKAIAERVFGDEVVPYQQLVRSSPERYVTAGVMDKDMALAVGSKLGGVAGDDITRFLRGRIREMRMIVQKQAATITNLETEKAAARMILETQLPVALEQMDEVGDLLAALPYSKNRQKVEDKWIDAYTSLKAVRTKLAVSNGVTAPPLPDAIRAEAEAAEERRLNKTPINIPLQFGFRRGGTQ